MEYRPEGTRRLLHMVASRRDVLRTGMLAAGAVAVGGPLLRATPAFAADSASDTVAKLSVVPDEVTDIKTIFIVAETAEQLAITLYRNIVRTARAGKLKPALRQSEIEALAAAGIEEQIHHELFAAVTGMPVIPTATHFSFPKADDTFAELDEFIFAQQQLEGVFDSAFLAAVRELASPPNNQPRLAQIAAQIAVIESEHRALGRQILANHGIDTIPNSNIPFTDGPFGKVDIGPGTLRTSPSDNWAFAPVFVESVPDAADLAKAAGYLSPRPGNDFTYVPINLKDGGYYQHIADKIQFQLPYINTAEDGD
ncbi:MAG: ferritin-like domain-containing protein [Candidatus Dormibacteraeota bacterium]|nr:ferritin-like domain-containing protein [Candidatus Dormibacteraeota bacterium]